MIGGSELGEEGVERVVSFLSFMFTLEVGKGVFITVWTAGPNFFF